MSRRIIGVLAGVGAVLLGIGVFAFSSLFVVAEVPGIVTTGEVLSLRTLDVAERVKVVYTTSGCRSGESWIFEFHGGPDARVAVVDTGLGWGSSRARPDKPVAVGVLALSTADLRGMDDLFQFYRTSLNGYTSTGQQVLQVEYYRGGEKIGEDKIVDQTPVEHWIYRREEAGEVEPQITRQMISFRTLFKRAWQEAARSP